jgi:hypothetical protein
LIIIVAGAAILPDFPKVLKKRRASSGERLGAPFGSVFRTQSRA